MGRVTKTLADILVAQVPGALTINATRKAFVSHKKNQVLVKDVPASPHYSPASPHNDQVNGPIRYVVGQAIVDSVTSLQLPMYTVLGFAARHAEQLSDMVTGPVVAASIIAPLFSMVRAASYQFSSYLSNFDKEDKVRLVSEIYPNTLANPNAAGSIAVHSLPSQVAELHYAGQGAEHGELELAELGLEGTLGYVSKKQSQ